MPGGHGAANGAELSALMGEGLMQVQGGSWDLVAMSNSGQSP
jgi:hypothetical protein